MDGRIVFSSRSCGRRRDGFEVEDLPGYSSNFRRIDQPVAAHPYTVIGFGQIGDDVAPLIVGDYDLGELGGQVGGFRDHPDAGFRTVSAGDHAADVVVVDANRCAGFLLPFGHAQGRATKLHRRSG